MTSLELYKLFLIQLNKNDSNRNININKGTFVIIYNQQSKIWIEDRVRKDLNSDRIDDVSDLLTLDTKLKKVNTTDKYTSFEIPKDFSELSSSYVIAYKDKCGDRVLFNWNSKNKNKNNLLLNENRTPSFEYEETFLTHNSGNINVYKTDFEIKDCFIDYYRTPKEIDIEGYIKTDGTASVNINPDLPDKLLNEILQYCKEEVIKTYVTPEIFNKK